MTGMRTGSGAGGVEGLPRQHPCSLDRLRAPPRMRSVKEKGERGREARVGQGKEELGGGWGHGGATPETYFLFCMHSDRGVACATAREGEGGGRSWPAARPRPPPPPPSGGPLRTSSPRKCAAVNRAEDTVGELGGGAAWWRCRAPPPQGASTAALHSATVDGQGVCPVRDDGPRPSRTGFAATQGRMLRADEDAGAASDAACCHASCYSRRRCRCCCCRRRCRFRRAAWVLEFWSRGDLVRLPRRMQMRAADDEHALWGCVVAGVRWRPGAANSCTATVSP
eukprot:165875-Chlamydomonas_euryale.AAC.1